MAAHGLQPICSRRVFGETFYGNPLPKRSVTRLQSSVTSRQLLSAARSGCGCVRRQCSTVTCGASGAGRNANSNETPAADALQRRGLLLGLSSAVLLAPLPSWAEGAADVYRDPSEGFTISVPPGWASGGGVLPGGGGFTGPSGARRTLAWFPPEDLSVNVSLVITNVGADYTSLGSFGNAETFGTHLVSSMDRSFTLRGPFKKPNVEVQTAQLLGAKERSKMYMLEYVVKKPQEEQRHLLSVVAMGFNGVYNRLYTVTAQCFEPDLPKYRATLESVVQSFQPPIKA